MGTPEELLCKLASAALVVDVSHHHNVVQIDQWNSRAAFLSSWLMCSTHNWGFTDLLCLCDTTLTPLSVQEVHMVTLSNAAQLPSRALSWEKPCSSLSSIKRSKSSNSFKEKSKVISNCTAIHAPGLGCSCGNLANGE